MDTFEAVRWVALRLVVDSKKKDPKYPDPNFQLREIFRWYSQRFHTPLHTVEELPLEDVLTAYYETTFAEMEEEELERYVRESLKTEEDRLEEERRAAEEEAEIEQIVREEREAQAAAATAAQEKFGKLEKAASGFAEAVRSVMTRDTELPAATSVPGPQSEISMDFGDLDEEEGEFGLLMPPKKRR